MFEGLGGFVGVVWLSFLFGVGGCVVVDAEVGLGRFDVELIAGTSKVQRSGFDEGAFALAEQVDDVFAAVGGDLMGVADGFGDLLSGED